jgi:hypothetical protein
MVGFVLFRRPDLDAIAAGTTTLAFRRWDAPRVRQGGRQRTPVGVIEVDAVERVDDVTDADAAAAGFGSRAALLAALEGRDGDIYRIALHHVGPDPRVELRESEPTGDELVELRRRVERMGPWAMHYLHAIAARPGVRAPDLAADFGLDTRPFKARVRRLKELGLTESLPIGYRLSPRGETFLNDEGARHTPGPS